MLTFCEWLQHVSWIIAISNSAPMISIVWLIHYLGMFLLVGTTITVDLRVLGIVGRNYGVAQFAEELFRWTWVGLGLMVLSGFVMFGSEATSFYPANAFRFKMLMLLAALTFGLIVQLRAPRWDQLTTMPATAKSIAFISLL